MQRSRQLQVCVVAMLYPFNGEVPAPPLPVDMWLIVPTHLYQPRLVELRKHTVHLI